MIIVVDGYNLLKQVFPREKGKLDIHREQLIRQLGFYKKQRADKVKEIILVFDGGYQARATREIRHGVVVIFSGQKRSADEWIIDYVERNKEKEIMLVTRDREIIDTCRKYGAEPLHVVDFYDIVQSRLLELVEQEMTRDSSQATHSSATKYEHKHSARQIESEAPDLLMEQAPLDAYKKDDEPPVERKKGKSHRPSKDEKRRMKKIKKL